MNNREDDDNNNLDNNNNNAFPPPQQDNAEVEDDHDEEEEEEEGDENRVLDGGVAGGASNADDSSTAPARRRASDCDLMLYITCAETMTDLAPNHPILKEGVVVSIGLDKNTKLSAVFHRYTEFCNEHSTSVTTRVEASDLEFFHCQLLHGNDTAESSALMKNDRIKVRRERAAERETQTELKRIQRESDKEYFKQLRHLLPDWSGDRRCDLILDCRGKIMDQVGRNQQVLSTKVRGHSVVLARRCKWLGSLIETARQKKAAQNIVTAEVEGGDIGDASPQSDGGIEFPKGNIVANTSSTLHEDNDGAQRRGGMDMEEDDEDEIVGVLPYPVPQNGPQAAMQRGGAAEIENDDDNDNEQNSDGDSMGRSGNNRNNSQSKDAKDAVAAVNDSNQLWITLPNHSPDAVKLLLEYLYTNRVIPLGHDAFVQACKTKPVKPNGPVSPYSSARRWPNNGLPQVSFSVALAGIALAEEAGIRRLSLMCEVAASQLVSSSNVVEALTMCTSQKGLTGNPLPRLREVAISFVLRYGPRGIYESAVFKDALEGRVTSIIPTLFSGTVEAMAQNDKQKKEDKKRDFEAITDAYFDELDRIDTRQREKERKKRRLELHGSNPSLAAEHVVNNDDDGADVFCDSVTSSWASETARRSLKRMSQHLNVNSFHVGRGSVYAARDAFGSRPGYGVGRRRNSSRRRNSERS